MTFTDLQEEIEQTNAETKNSLFDVSYFKVGSELLCLKEAFGIGNSRVIFVVCWHFSGCTVSEYERLL